MPAKQNSLMKYGVVAATISASSRVEEKEPPRLTTVIVEFEPATIECCCLCNRRCLLSFCLKYLDSEGNIVLWGEICENCAGKLTETVRPVDGLFAECTEGRCRTNES